MIARDLNVSQSVSRLGTSVTVFKRLVIVALLFVAGLIAVAVTYELGLFDLFLNSWTLFKVQNIQIRAELPLDEATIRSWLPKLNDKTLFSLRTHRLVGSLSTKPWVDEVAVRKLFPEALEITVTTRRPLAVGIQKGEGNYIDEQGRVIERVGLRNVARSLPIVTRREDSDWSAAQWSSIVREWPQESLGRVSELLFERYPYFRVFLTSPRWEVMLSAENCEGQLPLLHQLIWYTPSQLLAARKINLVLSKKAVVSRIISK